MKVIFTKAFANKKKGDELECDSMIASQLITKKVAKLVKKEE